MQSKAQQISQLSVSKAQPTESVCVCACVRICNWVCLCVCASMCICVCVYICTGMCVGVFVSYMCAYVCICVSVSVYLCVSVWVWERERERARKPAMNSSCGFQPLLMQQSEIQGQCCRRPCWESPWPLLTAECRRGGGGGREGGRARCDPGFTASPPRAKIQRRVPRTPPPPPLPAPPHVGYCPTALSTLLP